MYRLITLATLMATTLLLACANSAPVPEPGMEVLHHGWGEEMQVATDVDWNNYTKIILHTAPVEFMENWRSNQERLHGREMRDEDVERIKERVSSQLTREMYKTLSEQGGYELTNESGPGVMHFLPNIVDLNVQATGWVESSILESYPDSRGSMTVELVIRDSVNDSLLAVAWQRQSDPREGDMEMTTSVSNTSAFRLMSRSWADWLLKHLEEARSGA
jgi:hypothetical protein